MTRDEIITAHAQVSNKLLNSDLRDLHTARVVEALEIKRGDWADAHLTIEEKDVEWSVRVHIVVTATLLGVI